MRRDISATRAQVRDFMASARVDEAMCLLLDHPNRDTLYSICGVLMNLR